MCYKEIQRYRVFFDFGLCKWVNFAMNFLNVGRCL